MLAQVRLGLLAVLLSLPMLVIAADSENDDGDDAQILTGTIGSQTVVVSLAQDEGDAVYGRYFYQQYRQDIALEGTLKGDSLVLHEGPEESPSRPVLTLKETPEGWQGNWRNNKGKSAPVVLRNIEVPEAATDNAWWARLRNLHPYDYLRMHDVTLKQEESQTFMGYQLQWLSDPISGLRMFQLTSGYDSEQMARVNQLLRTRLYNEIISYHQCMVSDRFEGGEFEQQVVPKLLTPNLLSAEIFTSYDCGGAHPDFGSSPINLNIQTARTLGLEDVLWVGQGKAFHFVELDGSGERIDSGVSFDTFTEYRDTFFAPWLLQAMTAAHPTEMAAPQEEDECDYRDVSVWKYPTWYMTEQGIWLGPSFARVMRACEGPDWSLLPWAVVKQHPGGASLPLP